MVIRVPIVLSYLKDASRASRAIHQKFGGNCPLGGGTDLFVKQSLMNCSSLAIGPPPIPATFSICG